MRLAIRHPQALEHILSRRSDDIDVTGIGELGRSWRLNMRRLDGDSVLVRMTDRSAAVSAEKMRVDFVANASHELRTPLSTILGYAETLADERDLPADTRLRFGATIRDEARRMVRIIEDLMSLSRIEAERFLAPAESVSLDDIVDAAVANAPDGAKIRGLRLRRSIARRPSAGPRRPRRNWSRSSTICSAMRCAMAARAGLLDDRNLGRGLPGAVALTVTDHGPGIAREHLPRLTERFYRVDTARSRESGGTGLGLAIVKHIVERHRGTLDIRERCRGRTSVTVRLPATL